MNKIRRLWEERSEKYKYDIRGVLPKSFPNWLNAVLHNWTSGQVKYQISNFKPQKVLDLGCGYGRVAYEIIKNFPKCQVIGIDISKSYVEMFNANLAPRGRAYRGNIKNIKFRSNSFDVVYMITTLMYLVNKKDQEKAVSEIMRVLKPKGRFVFIERNPLGHKLLTLGGIITSLRGKKHKEIESVSFTRKELTFLITNAGGKIQSIDSFPFGAFTAPSLYISYTGTKK